MILVCIVLCARIWKRKGGSAGVGGLFGWLLGPIGVMVVLVAKPKAAKPRLPSSVPGPPMPVRPDSIPVRTETDVVAVPSDRFGDS